MKTVIWTFQLTQTFSTIEPDFNIDVNEVLNKSKTDFLIKLNQKTEESHPSDENIPSEPNYKFKITVLNYLKTTIKQSTFLLV